MLKQISNLLFFVAMLSAFAAFAEATPSPTDEVRASVDAVIALLKDDQLDRDSRREKMRVVINDRFDFRAMSQRTLATNWKKASDTEKQQFTDLFAQLIQNSYVSKIESYTNETVEYPGEKLKGRKAVVNTLIITSSAEIPVNYRVYLKNGKWRVYDVIIEGVSLISNYRSSYQQIVKKDGFPGLLARMEAKIKELENAPPESG
ncbi:MAG: ABC transporter substrate-binding protein [Pseudomonadota bacterium]